MIIEGIRSFLLRDGRDTGGHLVPAHGHVYLTSYRIVFLGSPWDPEGETHFSNYIEYNALICVYTLYTLKKKIHNNSNK